jgi:hypothetical protein
MFFTELGGAIKGRRFEYHLLALFIAAVLMVRGSGAFSLGQVLSGQSKVRAALRPAA